MSSGNAGKIKRSSCKWRDYSKLAVLQWQWLPCEAGCCTAARNTSPVTDNSPACSWARPASRWSRPWSWRLEVRRGSAHSVRRTPATPETRFAPTMKRVNSEHKSIEISTLSRALEKYQCAGMTPHSEDLFCTVLKRSTTPSGHTRLGGKKSDENKTKLQESVYAPLPHVWIKSHCQKERAAANHYPQL